MLHQEDRDGLSRVLIVEDNPSQLRTLAALMEEEGLDVVGCRTGAEACAHMQQENFGVAIVDLHLPDLSGSRLLEQLHALNSKTRIIINTGYSSFDSAKEAVNLGAFAYVEKAGDPDELLHHVHRACRQRLARYAEDLEAAVTERTTLLRASEEKFRAQYKGIPIPTYTWKKVGEDFVLVDCNDAAQSPTSGKIVDFIGQTAAAMYPNDLQVQEDLGRSFTLRTTIKREMLHRLRTTDETKYLAVSYTFVPPDMILVFTEDITERKRAEKALQESNSLLQQALADLETSQRHIVQQERLAAVGQLSAGVAHDFNNILTSILGFAELLQLETGLTPAAHNGLQTIVTQGQRAASLIRQILDFSHQSALQIQPLAVVPLLEETIDLLGRTLPEHLQLQLEVEPGDFFMQADRGQVQQVLTNLALNARDAMPRGGTLSFVLSSFTLQPGQHSPVANSMPAGEWLALAVSDTGSGIAPAVRERIFEPFFTTKEVGQGTGLGLSQAYGIVTQHKGYIRVRSEEGQGSTFTLYFPRFLGREKEAEEVKEAGVAREGIQGHGEGVLLVEDDEHVLNALGVMLEELNYRVIAAASVAEGLRKYEAHRDEVAMVVTDWVMPGDGGEALCRSLLEREPEVKIVVVSGYPVGEAARALLACGQVEWLTKPLKLTEFGQVLRQVLHPTCTPTCTRAEPVLNLEG